MERDLDELCVNAVRFLAVDAIERARSGHPGMPMGAATLGYVLFTRFLRHNPKDPAWPNRDRFVLSAGHGSMLLYSLLHLTGYDLSLDDLKAFRQWESKTPGHPEFKKTPGVETTTGPLGQGFANGVGMAMAERYLASYFNRPGFPIVDHWTYAIVSDGDLMEGISHEAASIAGHLRLGRLIYLYDDNNISIEGPTSITFTDDIKRRFEAYNWQVLLVRDGNHIPSLVRAIGEAKKEERRPTLIIIKTRIGYGSPNKEGTSSVHGEPLGKEEARLTKRRLGWPADQEFFVPQEVYEHMRDVVTRGQEEERAWTELFDSYRDTYPELAEEWEDFHKGRLDPGLLTDLPSFRADQKGMATRVASGIVLNHIALKAKNIIGGSADLAPSNKTLIEGDKDFQAPEYTGRNIRFGVREHAMGAILNGMALHGGLIPYGGTFLIFSDYMRPAIRMAAMMGLKVIYVFTHDSIGLGEDGPTHQPVEQLMGLRSIPGLCVIRPSDANETIEAWKVAVGKEGPVALILTRQSVPTLNRDQFAHHGALEKGAYVLKDPHEGRPEVTLLATGSEVHLALAVQEILSGKGRSAKVVSMPSWELFFEQPEDYRKRVLGEGSLLVSIEAGITLGWERMVGRGGIRVGIDRFGASAPHEVLYQRLGLSADAIAQRILEALEAKKA